MIKKKELVKKLSSIEAARQNALNFIKNTMELNKTYRIATHVKMYDMNGHRVGIQVREIGTGKMVFIDGARVTESEGIRGHRDLEFHIYQRVNTPCNEWKGAYDFALEPHEILAYLKCDDEE